MFADWTDRIEAGELPFDKPQRPKGIERNVVISAWDWGTPTIYLHDAISTDKRNPTVNANGLIYGSPEESSDFVPVLDPVHNTTKLIKHPYRDPATPSAKDDPRGPSVFWGDEAIWDGHTSIHNPMMDEKGRVWFTARIRPAAESRPLQGRLGPAFGPGGAAGAIGPAAFGLRSEDRKMDPDRHLLQHAAPVFRVRHRQHALDQRRAALSGVVGWLNTKQFDATGDEMKSQGWTPTVANVTGTGKRETVCCGGSADRSHQGQMGQGRVLRRDAEPEGRRDLGPVDGSGFLAH